MTVKNGMLTPRQRTFVVARASGLTIAAAAERVGCSLRQANRMSVQPLVRAAISAALDAALADTSAAMLAGSRHALDVLVSVMDDPDTPAGVRERACVDWLTVGYKLTELVDLGARVAALEQARDQELRG